MSSDEPEYLRALKQHQERHKNPTAPPAAAPAVKKASPTPAEREALRWAQEVGGKQITVAPSLSGARCAILVHPITPFGAPRITLEGLPDREALATRVRAATGAGENVVGCYELTTGRPLTVATVEGKITFTAGQPRAVAKAESPEQMIRRAAAQAEVLAKSRKADD
ncbi:MAG: hypothetical protein ACREMO_10255, partial [Gemmatimonadales bacterium]